MLIISVPLFFIALYAIFRRSSSTIVWLPPEIPISNISIWWLGRQFRRWSRINISRFELFKELYDEIRPNDSGSYLANVFEKKLVIAKPELVELVSNKRFSYFFSRPRSAYFENDHLTHSIFNLDGEHWKTKRERLSYYAFSNNKLEAMFPQIADCAEEISSYLFCGRENNEVDVNELSRTFVMTVFYCCVFGQKIERIDSNSEFAKMAKQFRHMDTFRFKFFDMFSCALSRWRHIFGGLINAKEATEYFKRLINERIEEKENSGEEGHDFLSTFMKIERSENSNGTYKWDRKATEAHCVVFLLGGFTATSSTIAFTLYELAKNSDVQKKLKKEIDSFLGSSDKTISPEIMREMTYLDSVIHETLRKYPPFSANVRICGKRCEMPDNNLTIEKGKTVVTPVSGLHYDPKYYPNPDVFDPERFRNGRSPPPYAYLPFGEGPRKCIGQRFAILIVKTVIIKLLSQFRWSIIPGNDVLPNFQPRKFTTTVSQINLRYELRSI